MSKILGMASNRGRNLLNIHRQRPGGAELAVVVSNRSDAPILESAEEQGIPSVAVPHRSGESRFEHERRIIDRIEDYDIDVVCLDGYMRVLSSTFLDAVPLTLNVHPSLLPSFPGMNAWADALDAGVRITGCTVHVVTNAVDDTGAVIEEEIDAGPIVTQEPIPVYEGDSPAKLKERVLYQGEFIAYPRAVEWIARDEVTYNAEAQTISIDIDVNERFPRRRLNTVDRVGKLRYGENPHQAAAVYRDPRDSQPSIVGARQLNPDAKTLSYNNYNDADAGLGLVQEFDAPAAVVIKHTNPAGCATANTLSDAYRRALATDPKSAFGGVVALNRTCGQETAAEIVESFKEIVVAPAFTDDAIATLRERDTLRVLAVDELTPPDETPIHEKDLAGGRLVQDADTLEITEADLEIVTDRAPTEAEREAMLFAWPVAKHVKSNAIVFAAGTETVGVGAGQVSRVDAVRLAAMKADRDAEGKDSNGAVMASDAFFPFPDGVEIAAEAGVTGVIQPGGSKRDEDVIAAANDHDLAMAMTGQRCFRHD